MKSEEIENMFNDCFEALSCSNSPFSEWEDEFLNSIQEQWDNKKSLSDNQYEILVRCWEKI